MPDTTPTGFDARIEAIARVCHAANRELQHLHQHPGIPVAAPWDELPEGDRLSIRSGVKAALDGADPEELHDKWCRLKLALGWRYGLTKDDTTKRHPCLVPYDQLPESQWVKDELFAAIVDALGDVPPADFDLDGRHSDTANLARWLTPNPRLSGAPVPIAAMCRVVAVHMVNNLDDGPELTAGLRLLLQAKDSFVRAAL